MDSLVIIVLFLLVIAQAVERFFYSKQVLEERREQMLAFLSKNSIDMAVAIKTGKGKPEVQKEPDELDITEAQQDEFDKMIKQQVAD